MAGDVELVWSNFDTKTTVTGLDAFAPEDRPPVEASFLFFHGMVGVGFAMIAIAALGFLYFRHGSLHERRWLLWILVFSVLGPQIANQLGWFAAEVGRQPWIVYGLMRTPEGLVQSCAGERGAHVADFVHVHLLSAVRGFHLSAQRQNPARPG